MGILAPSILAADFSNLEQQIRLTEMGGADWIHCDVMDGHFVPDITIGPIVIEAVRKITKLPVDVHLMIENPDNFIEPFAKAGADLISIHVEEVTEPVNTINKIKQLGCKAGIVVNPNTPVNSVKDFLHYIDLLLIMTVEPGAGGQKFINDSVCFGMATLRGLIKVIKGKF